ncbi:Callose synthase [Actinidia chinensis var. chinensis]|uniref:Callose synthase n=1 Tax=Actinidia chinensis var. chinensis TaxID=1590841 RepID=A0A2R6QQ74_ACTCC|nr:Callose synthase [Actinidia chinensis var. chinensis]
MLHKLRDAIHRLKLRCGLGHFYKKIESSQVEATKFALIWNEIIITMREEGIISDREWELMKLPPNCWDIRVIRWPCFLLCNELLLALSQAGELGDPSDHGLWFRICKNEYTLCAVIEAYDSIRYLFRKIIKYNTEEYSIVSKLFTEIDNDIQIEKFTGAYNMTVYTRFSCLEIQCIMSQKISRQDGVFPFFSNSLFMNMPRAPQVGKMMAFSVRLLTTMKKFCMGKNRFEVQNEDGISTLFYLQKINEDEWENFMEQMFREGMRDDKDIWSTKARDLRLWASYRGQTLDGSQDIASFGSLKKHTGLDGIGQQTSRNLNRASNGKGDPRAEDILYLMKNNEAIRVAYVDEVHFGREEVEYYSVLVKYDQQLKKEVEIYRIRLPGPLKIGEGKPENQNHAIIFTRGDAVQTIDMNQDNCFEEALKMRNLLEEFKKHYGIRKPTILGVREYVFTDVFDRFWFLTRSGISKASRVINISEDIFAGFNCTLRGGNVTHHEYIQVGKGRDVGLNQISMFEAKVSSGNGEQVLSRDVYRLGHRLDFFHMLSFYFTSVGSYFNTMIVVLTVYAFLWGRLYLPLSGVEMEAKGRASSGNNDALGTIINQQFIIQNGLFTALPMIHKSFAVIYRLYARSHFVKAIELGVILTVYASHSPLAMNTFVYIAMTISCWFLVVSWMMSPFVFNPSGFDWLETVYDFDDFMNWIWYIGILVKADQSWETWWYEEQNHLRTTGVWGKLLEIILDLRFFFLQYGIVYRLKIEDGNKSIGVYLLSWLYMVAAVTIYVVMTYARDKYAAKEHKNYLLVQVLVTVATVVVIVLLLQFTDLVFLDLITSMLAFISTGWGLILIAQVLRPFL